MPQVRIFVQRSANRSTASSWKLERFVKRSFRTSSKSLIEKTLSRSRFVRRSRSRCISFCRWYDNVDFDILWQIVTQDLPPLVAELEKILSPGP